MKNFFPFFVFMMATCILSVGCKDDNPDIQIGDERKFNLYFNYYNPTGLSPQVVLNSEFQSSPEIVIDSTDIYAGSIGNNQIEVEFNNVFLVSSDATGQINYEMEEVVVERYINGTWIEDVEFDYEFGRAVDLDMVMVLDASESLGADFPQIKDYVRSLMNQIYTEIPTAQIGIVEFSEDVSNYPLTNNVNYLNAFLDDIDQGQYTAMFNGMKLGIDMLQGSPNRTKSMITFTDGIDNQSQPQYDADYILNRLVGANGDGQITSYMIGLGQSLDKVTLDQLAVNGGVSRFPTDLGQLATVFDNFARTISAVHQLRFIPNQQMISEENQKSLRFVIKVKAI